MLESVVPRGGLYPIFEEREFICALWGRSDGLFIRKQKNNTIAVVFQNMCRVRLSAGLALAKCLCRTISVCVP